ncbi:hypothetical protein ACQPYK_25075 [Streptosporangium sp. CA-135522]|uniref:hypothetical protein n=1 Tax=Streptosporangium sp. CA-135522 TaxID=3240072 RepID=UPI003D8EA1DF
MATKYTKKRPRADYTPEERAEYGARKQADKQIAIHSRESGAAALAQSSTLIDGFRVYAGRVMGHRTLGNALGMLVQNPQATRVNSAFFWGKEGRKVRPEAESMRLLARRKGNKIVESENADTGETEQTIEGKWSGWTSERVFDVRDTVPKKTCPHCGTAPGDTCPDSCQVYVPVLGPVPTRDEVAELLDRILRDEGGFCLDFLDAESANEGEDADEDSDE